MTAADPVLAELDEVEQVDPVASRRPVVAGAFAAIWALLVGVGLISCVVMLIWATSPNSLGDAAAAWRAVGLTWLGAHHAPLTISDRSVTLLPMGALLLGLLLTRRSGVWASRMLPMPTREELVGIFAGAGLAYGLGAAGIAWLSARDSAGAAPVTAFLAAAVVGVAGVAWGMSRELRLSLRVRSRVSEPTWRTIMAGLAATLALLASGAALVAASLIWQVGQLAGALDALDAGIVGGAGLTLLGVLSLPNLALWAVSVMAGPGFQVGDIGSITAFGGEVGTLPALPVLAAVPAASPPWAPMLLAIPVAVGVLAGRVRWGRDLPTASSALQAAAGVAAIVLLAVGGLMVLASGSLGGVRLGWVGPHPVLAAAACAALVALGFLGHSARESLALAWGLYRAQSADEGGEGHPPAGQAQSADEGGDEGEPDAQADSAAEGEAESDSGGGSDSAGEVDAEAARGVSPLDEESPARPTAAADHGPTPGPTVDPDGVPEGPGADVDAGGAPTSRRAAVAAAGSAAAARVLGVGAVLAGMIGREAPTVDLRDSAGAIDVRQPAPATPDDDPQPAAEPGVRACRGGRWRGRCGTGCRGSRAGGCRWGDR